MGVGEADVDDDWTHRTTGGVMAISPWEQEGMALDHQFRNWRELAVDPVDPTGVEGAAATLARIGLATAALSMAIDAGHTMQSMTDDAEISAALALHRRIETQQHQALSSLQPVVSFSEQAVIMAYGTLAVLCRVAREEPDPMIRRRWEFVMVDAVDELYRVANLNRLLGGHDAARLIEHRAEILPGRPLPVEHRHPGDDLAPHFSAATVDPVTRLTCAVVRAVESQSLSWYRQAQWAAPEPVARSLGVELTLLHEQRLTMVDTLAEPLESPLRRWLVRLWVLCNLSRSAAELERDDRVRRVFEFHHQMDVGRLRHVDQLLQRFEGVSGRDLLGETLPARPLDPEVDKDHVRYVLGTQIDLRADGPRLVDVHELPANHRYFDLQRTVNGAGVPSEQVIDLTRERHHAEYRDETEGAHPVASLRR